MMATWPRRQIYRGMLNTLCGGEAWIRAMGTAPINSSQAWAVANQAVYVPIYAPEPWQPGSIVLLNGASVSGLFDVAVYVPDSEGKPGTRIWHSGLVLQNLPNIRQSATVAAGGGNPVVPAGLAYLALAFDNTTATIIAIASLTTDGKNILAGIFTEASACPLPATATPVITPTACKVPLLVAATA